MTTEQKNAAINYMINHAENATTPNGNPAELVYQILIRIMPPQIVTEAIQEATKQEE